MEFLRNISMDRHHLSPFRKDLVLLLITPDEVINEGYCPLLYDLFISYVASSTQSVRRRRLFFRFQDDIARSIAEHIDRDSFFIHRIHTCIAFEKQHLIPSELQSEYLLLFALILRYQKVGDKIQNPDEVNNLAIVTNGYRLHSLATIHY